MPKDTKETPAIELIRYLGSRYLGELNDTPKWRWLKRRILKETIAALPGRIARAEGSVDA